MKFSSCSTSFCKQLANRWLPWEARGGDGGVQGAWRRLPEPLKNGGHVERVGTLASGGLASDGFDSATLKFSRSWAVIFQGK